MATLDHTYHGIGYRVDARGDMIGEGELISGAFAVLMRDRRCALLDNGESGRARGRWIVYDLDELELAA